jgi:hypothetical protein
MVVVRVRFVLPFRAGLRTIYFKSISSYTFPEESHLQNLRDSAHQNPAFFMAVRVFGGGTKIMKEKG